MKQKINFSLALMLFLIFNVFSRDVINLREKFSFPKDNDMNNQGCILVTPINMINSDNMIYISDQSNSTIFVFDLNGNFIKKIGKKGQSPSEFSNQHSIDVLGNNIYIEDQGSFTFKIFDIKGKFLSFFRQDRVLRSFVIIDDKIFGQPNIRPLPLGKSTPIFIIYKLDGTQLKVIDDAFPKTQRDRFDYDNKVSIKRYKNQIHCLQKYGMQYRIYNIEGNKIKEFELQNHDKSIWCLTSLYVTDNEIYAAENSDEFINVLVFDFDGKIKRRYRLMEKNHEKFSIRDFFVVKKNNSERFYFMLWSPDVNVVVAEPER
jgi:hypothetical protein